MTKDELIPHIRKTWSFAKALGIGETFSGPTALQPSDLFRTTALDPTSSYEMLYLVGLREGQYNILLSDYAFLQFGLGKKDGVRFAYYPNPFLGASSAAVAEVTELQEFAAEGLISVDEVLHRIADIKKAQHPPLVRYEFSTAQYVEASHPASHFHLGFHADNRWPVKRYLTAHAFALLIFRLFYLDFWGKAGSLRSGQDEVSFDQAFEQARAECRLLYEEEFSSNEDKRFHFV